MIDQNNLPLQGEPVKKPACLFLAHTVSITVLEGSPVRYHYGPFGERVRKLDSSSEAKGSGLS